MDNFKNIFGTGSALTGPEMVPDARRSPGLMLHPDTAWWANCCFIVQYM
jgi:hypothetical protein